MSIADTAENTSEEQRQKLAAILQMRAMYEMTTKITKRCFEACVPKINPRMEDTESACLTNCAANYLRMKMTIVKQLMSSIQIESVNIGEGNEEGSDSDQ